MKQTVQAVTEREGGQRQGADEGKPGRYFSALFAVAGSRAGDSDVIRKRLRLSENAFRTLLEGLQARHLVDVVSHLRGDVLVEHLTLTEEGRSALQQMMERMCELPESE